jgi:hypothetical protein
MWRAVIGLNYCLRVDSRHTQTQLLLAMITHHPPGAAADSSSMHPGIYLEEAYFIEESILGSVMMQQ